MRMKLIDPSSRGRKPSSNLAGGSASSVSRVVPVRPQPKAGLHEPELVRLLSRLTGLDVPRETQGFEDGVAQWLGWGDAIALSSALAAAPPASGARGLVAGAAAGVGATEAREFERAVSTWTEAIARAVAEAPDDPDFPPHRRFHAQQQRLFESALKPWRARLRAALSARSNTLARLAALDAVLEAALAPRERLLLATVPTWLEGHFHRLRRAEPGTAAAPVPKGGTTVLPHWLLAFRADLQRVLLAELDLRLQPLHGLAESLASDLSKDSP